jgi:small conductance mechanosensitive channel
MQCLPNPEGPSALPRSAPFSLRPSSRRLSRCALILGILLALGARSAPLGAQGAAAGAVPADVPAEKESGSVESLEDLVASIEDPAKREKLLEQLRILLEARRGGKTPASDASQGRLLGGLIGFLDRVSSDVRRTAVELGAQARALPSKWNELRARLEDPDARAEILGGVAVCATIIIAAAGTAFVAWLIVRRASGRIARERVGGAPGLTARRILARVWRMVSIALIGLIPAAVLVGVALGSLAVLQTSPEAAAVTLAFVWAVALQRAAAVAVDALLQPQRPTLRFLPMSDERATALSRSLRRLSAFWIYGYFALRALEALGAQNALTAPLRGLYGLILLAGSIFLVLRERGHLRAHLLQRSAAASAAAAAAAAAAAPSDAASPGGASADGSSGAWRSALYSALGLWWVVAILYLVGLYMVWASGVEGSFIFVVSATLRTLAVIAVALGVAALIRVAARRMEAWSGGVLWSLPELRDRVPQYVKGFSVVLRTACLILAACIALEVWGVSALEALGSEAGQGVVGALAGVLMVVLLCAATIDVATVFTRRYLEARERGGSATGKVRTLVPLAQKTIRVVVYVAGGLMVLGQIGVEIGPILAGVGVLGLAIGFGAQTLVKDIITGVFLLVEDTVSVGDVIQVNGISGLVEVISIRTIRLRDTAGNVHTIPYSSVAAVMNMTKDYSRWVIEAAVAYREDVDEVMGVLKELGEGLRADPEFGKDMLEPIEILGLERFDDSAVVVRARITTRPLQQWRLGREFNRRMKKAFDERGIEMPFPHQTVYFGELKDGSAPALRIRSQERVAAGGGDSDEDAQG